MDKRGTRKTVLVHIGPHKTGSTAIQKSLLDASEILSDEGIAYVHTPQTHQAALDLANERFDMAEQRLSQIALTIGALKESHIILSQEDFCGPLIGRSAQRRVYPKLTKNMRIIMRAMRPHDVKFLFFVRDEADWLRSCYHQHLKFRSRFFDFNSFQEQFGADLKWAFKLEKPKTVFGDNLIISQYTRDPKAGIRCLLDMLPIDETLKTEFPFYQSVNASPHADQIHQLERINEMSEFGPSAWFAKSFFLKGIRPKASPQSKRSFLSWPPMTAVSNFCALPKLLERSKMRVSQQKVADVLPQVAVDLEELARERLPEDVDMPDLERMDMAHQATLLNYHLRGKSRLSHLNALTISYLRRDTPHTDKARTLFHRIWREQGVVLVNELSTRWLISTLQTFLDHGENEAQRSIGTAGYFYGNMLKIYEGERAIEGLEQDARYENTAPQTKNKFRGLDRYNVGGTDLMLNTNALALEIAQRDEIAGLVLQEFLLRVKNSGNVFTRHDRTRQEKRISVDGFDDVWTFFEPGQG